MRWLRSALVVSFVFVGGGTFAAHGADVQFEAVSAEATGIRASFQQWYDEEMKRQGGPGKQSHGWWPWGLRAFDYDRDGDLDLLASHHGVPHSIVLKSLFHEIGKFQFVNFTTELGVDHRDLPGADDRPWIWDFDGDGWLDVAGFSDESKPKSAWNHQGTKFTVTEGPLFAGLSHPREVLDLDGDGYLDLDGGKNGQWFYVPEQRAFRHDRTPRFAMPEAVPADVLAEVREQSQSDANRFFRLDFLTHDLIGYDTLGYAPRPIDLNGDGRNDLVIHGSGGYGAIYLGRYLLRESTGKLTDRTSALGLPIAGAPILIDDLTGDGRTDLLIVGEKTGGLYVQNERGIFDRRERALTEFLQRRGPYLLRAWRADLDNDGDPDLVVSNPRGGRAAAFENRGDGEFTKVLDVPAWDSNPIVIADLDDDGRLDLAIGGGGGPDRGLQITLYFNRTAEVGNYGKIVPRMAAPNPFAVGAVVEVFPAGGLDDPKLRPLKIEKAHSDGTPIHFGLGAATAYDLRVTFPQGKVVESRGVTVNGAKTVDLAEGRTQ